MKKLQLSLMSALAAITLIGFGCTKPDPAVEHGPAKLVVVSDNYTESESFDNLGGEVSLWVGSNYSWTASVEEGVDWIELTAWEEQRDGAYKDSKVTLLVAPSDEETERTAIVTFTSRDQTVTFTVTQGATFLTPSTTELEFVYSNDKFTVNVSTNALDWDAEIISDVEWCGIDIVDNKITVSTTQPNAATERTAVLRIFSGNLSKEVSLTQLATFLTPSATELGFIYGGGTQKITVSTNVAEWSASIAGGAEWFNVGRDNLTGVLTVTALPYDGAQERNGVLRLSSGNLSTDVSLLQVGPAGIIADREVVRLQEATVGAGINIVLMGDGYTLTSMVRRIGKYETDMRTAMEHFFSIYPYTEYRDYFNVWMVGAVSEEEGISISNPRRNIDTALGCIWEGERSTGINCSFGTVRGYARLVPDDGSIDEMTVLIPINADIYAGTCLMEMGFAIAMCPVSTNTNPGMSFKHLLIHETNGHAFGKLGDEYINHPNQNINNSDEGLYWKNMIIANHEDEIGGELNISLSGDIAESPWAGLAGNPKYTGADLPDENRVGMYEGASYYGYGAWRSEPHSCMDYNFLYFNAPSRWAIVRRIMAWSDVDEDYTIEEFMVDDVVPEFPKNTGMGTRSLEEFRPLGRPILMD